MNAIFGSLDVTELIASQRAILLVLEILPDGEYILTTTAQIARQDTTLRLGEQISELVDLALKVAVECASGAPRVRRRR